MTRLPVIRDPQAHEGVVEAEVNGERDLLRRELVADLSNVHRRIERRKHAVMCDGTTAEHLRLPRLGADALLHDDGVVDREETICFSGESSTVLMERARLAL